MRKALFIITNTAFFPKDILINCIHTVLLNLFHFIVQESPLCELIPMKSNDKAFTFTCNDFSEEAKLEVLAVRLQTAESKYYHKIPLQYQ